MKKIILLVFFVLCLVLVAILISNRFGFRENSANRLLKSIGKVEELNVFSLRYDGKDFLFATRDTDIIRKFLGAIEFEQGSQAKAIVIKSPGVMEFITTGVTTQRLHWIEFGWGYIRADNGLLSGDVGLTKTSSQNLADWLTKQGIEIPERSPSPKLIKSK